MNGAKWEFRVCYLVFANFEIFHLKNLGFDSDAAVGYLLRLDKQG